MKKRHFRITNVSRTTMLFFCLAAGIGIYTPASSYANPKDSRTLTSKLQRLADAKIKYAEARQRAVERVVEVFEEYLRLVERSRVPKMCHLPELRKYSGTLDLCKLRCGIFVVFSGGERAMPRLNRSEICASDEIQAFHLINRCVRRTFLCGKDRRSGKDYSHRKEWIRQRLEELAGIFAVDILGLGAKNVPPT